jgi:hypothetical protein
MDTKALLGRSSAGEYCGRREVEGASIFNPRAVGFNRHGGFYVNRMQKYVEQVNIKPSNVITQIHGAGSLRIIKAGLSDERDSDKLTDLCHERILDRKRQEVKNLEGNYNEVYPALLAENMRLWEEHRASIKRVEEETGKLLEELNRDNRDPEVTGGSNPARHHPPQIKDLHRTMVTTAWHGSYRHIEHKRQHDASFNGRGRNRFKPFSNKIVPYYPQHIVGAIIKYKLI